jgi:outer membrane receptor protein involved in Fe transport
MKNNARAWNTLPFESISSLTWNPLKKLTITSELYIFAVGHYLDYKNVDKSLSGGTDFNVGGSFKFNPHWSAFININNIFSQKYERWHNYPVFGLNGIGGFKVNF